jgi:hypothetical protein
MSQKPSMLFACLAVWMYAAVACAALPFLYALPQLKSLGVMAPMIAALMIGVVAGLPLSSAARRLSGFGSLKGEKNVWAALTAREAVLYGIIAWGVPLGLMFAVDDFLASSDMLEAVPNLIVWPVTGIAFGLMLRWQAQRRLARQNA